MRRSFVSPILWFYAAGFSAAGVYIFAGGRMSGVDNYPFGIELAAVAYFFPAVLYAVGAKWLAPAWTLPGTDITALAPAPQQSLRLISLGGALYLSDFIAMYLTSVWSVPKTDQILLAWSVPLAMFLLWLFLGLLHSQFSSYSDFRRQAWQPRNAAEGRVKSRGWISDRFLALASRLLLPSLLSPLGAVLVVLSLFLNTSESGSGTGWSGWYILLGGGTWATSRYGFGEGVAMLRPVLAILGRGLYAGGLIVAGLSVIAVASARFWPKSLHALRFLRWIFGCTAILAAYSITDLFFGWLGFFSSGSSSAQMCLAFLWLSYCLLLLALGIRLAFVGAPRLSEEEPLLRHAFLLLYFPLVLFNMVLLPYLIGFELGGLACFFIGLQFLCWSSLEWSARSTLLTAVDTHG
jgi:hypothetical protein